jgi:putative DNA primase/helicase
MKLPFFKSPVVLGLSRYAASKHDSTFDLRNQKTFTRAELEIALPDWVLRIVTEQDGSTSLKKLRPYNTTANIEAVIRLYGWVVRFNIMTKRTELTRHGVVIPGDDIENTALILLGDHVVLAGLTREGLSKLVDVVAVKNSYHPVLDWIKFKPWDGVSRLYLFHQTLHLVQPTKALLNAKLLNCWALQVIGTMMEPNGITAAGALVLSGPQNCGKSYWVMNLCPVPGAIGTGLHLDPAQKDSVLASLRYVITELGEIDSTTSRSHTGMLKAFLTNGKDVIRLPYAAKDTEYPRRTVFVGTVNGTGFLVDDTGNRRFWVLEVDRCDVLSPDVMQQVWAEYMHMYEQGERWHLDQVTLAQLNASNVDHTRIDPLRELIATHFDWRSVTWNAVNPSNWRAFTDVKWLTATDVCILAGWAKPSRADSTRAGTIVRELQSANASPSGAINFKPVLRKSNGVTWLGVPVKTLGKGAL